MINKDRVRTMTRLAIYEEGQGVADDKMNGYFKNDYIVGHMVGSFVSGTIACLLIVFVYCCYHYDTLLIQTGTSITRHAAGWTGTEEDWSTSKKVTKRKTNMLTTVFEIRKKIIEAYGKYEYIIAPAFKFAVAFLLILTIDKHIGFNAGLTNKLLGVIIALVCTLVPMNFMAAIMVMLVLAHLYTLSLETMIVAAVIFMLMLLLYFRFSPKDTVMLLLLPLAFVARIEYAVPVVAGLLFGPGSAVGVGFGVVITKYLSYVEQNKAVLGNSEIGPATVDNFRNIVDALMQNKAMWIMAGAFATAAIVVFFIRRVETAHSWTIAIIAGNVVELFILLFGDMQFDTNIDLAKVFLGVFLSLIVELLVEFFCFMVDYTRIENVQFEDDDYYYYVKAVPKVSVSDSIRIVKTISTSENSGADFREQVSRKVTAGSAESNE